jgi:flagellar basal body P-ring formation protein FlgA
MAWSRNRFSNRRANLRIAGFRAFLPWGPVGGRQAIAAHWQEFAGLNGLARNVLNLRHSYWRRSMTTIFRHAVLLSLLISANAVAGDFQSLDAIDARAAHAAGSTVRPVDRRLKLASCPETLQADPPAMGAVAIRCASLGWRVRVVVEGKAALAASTPMIIKRGDPVSVNFVAEGFSVTTSGIAEGDARIGERVRVRVEQKANPVMGEAIEAGSVRVGN